MEERSLNVNTRSCRYRRQILLGLHIRSPTVLSLFQPGVLSSTRSLPFSPAPSPPSHVKRHCFYKVNTVKWPLIKMSASPPMAEIDLKSKLRGAAWIYYPRGDSGRQKVTVVSWADNCGHNPPTHPVPPLMYSQSPTTRQPLSCQSAVVI